LLAFKAGVDLETPDPDGFKNLKQLVLAGKISKKELDETVLRILIAKFRLGLFDDPYVDPGKAEKKLSEAKKKEQWHTKQQQKQWCY
jgi:beta-glucosidase